MKIGFLGCGNMGTAILDGVVSQGIVSDPILVANRKKSSNDILVEKYGVLATTKVSDLAEYDVVILGIKPQGIDELKFIPSEGTILVSLLAGTSVARLREKFPMARIVRTMPNLGQFAGKGMTGIFFDPDSGFEESEISFIESLFSAGGEVLILDAEEKIDWIGAISGSGPAYFFCFAEYLMQAAIELGFTEPEADLLVRQTLLGAGEVANKFTDTSLAEWKQKVMSPGGTTEQAIFTFEKGKLDTLVQKAVKAAMKRTREMSR
jgi:pyrroline-5-carboxylate reductase